ncbi:MAG: hypothetical protein LBS50_01415 [Prevotellaceae bacterium]|jgi:hypothetical protein|nr:hypothetical protein [Prevotellaceae bacterium]
MRVFRRMQCCLYGIGIRTTLPAFFEKNAPQGYKINRSEASKATSD